MKPKTALGCMSAEEAEQRFRAYLDKQYPRVTIAATDYSTSYALRQVAPGEYRHGLRDWVSREGVTIE